MSVVLYTVNLYICVFMTFFTSYCFCDTRMDPGMNEWMNE